MQHLDPCRNMRASRTLPDLLRSEIPPQQGRTSHLIVRDKTDHLAAAAIAPLLRRPGDWPRKKSRFPTPDTGALHALGGVGHREQEQRARTRSAASHPLSPMRTASEIIMTFRAGRRSRLQTSSVDAVDHRRNGGVPLVGTGPLTAWSISGLPFAQTRFSTPASWLQLPGDRTHRMVYGAGQPSDRHPPGGFRAIRFLSGKYSARGGHLVERWSSGLRPKPCQGSRA
ncbi:hypothetical protein B0H15DRAFT_280456 [Mycena belliarum]|uniref:Uncharacterized protein n=1 Tax=Mycena belliarum TaxID=1033014 RepID=A0AAD6XUT1_9AGAR|nr:hypothetical protein B0H15DRAFT_280456 [Mycena belliae]